MSNMMILISQVLIMEMVPSTFGWWVLAVAALNRMRLYRKGSKS